MNGLFKGVDFADFWEESEYAESAYQDDPLTDEMVKAAEAELGYKLPLSYITLMRNRNGGIPKNASHPMNEPTSWAENHISVTGIMSIGWEAPYSICGDMGSAFMIDEWGYPDIGVYICTTPTAGHNMVLLDYSKCGKQGEPEVIFVDQEDDYKKTFIAKDFETFILGLVKDEVYNTDDEYLPFDIAVFENGDFSPLLKELISKEKSNDFDKILRNLLTAIVKEKSVFALHDDPKSRLCYAIQFYLLSRFQSLKSREQFLKVYPQLIALPSAGISTNGYSLDFIEEWFDNRISLKEIRKPFFGGLQFSDEYKEHFFQEIKSYE